MKDLAPPGSSIAAGALLTSHSQDWEEPMRRLGALALSLLCVVAGAGVAQAQDEYPSKPIKIIVPCVPGGATDIVGRILADQMGKSLGQSVIVENKPGAFGIIA